MSKHELPPKDQALVAIGAAVAAGCRPCTTTLIRAARAAGACERGIRLAIETGLYAGNSAMRTMAAFAESEQGTAPELDAAFRAEKEQLTALILAGASFAAHSTELFARYVAEAEALDCSKGALTDALLAARTVAKTAASKIDSHAAHLGFTLQGDACCPEAAEAQAAPAPAAAGCGCDKGNGCP